MLASDWSRAHTLVVAEPDPTLIKFPSSLPLKKNILNSIEHEVLEVEHEVLEIITDLAHRRTAAMTRATTTRTPAPTPIPTTASVESTCN